MKTIKIMMIIFTILSVFVPQTNAKTLIDGVDIDLMSENDRINFLRARKAAMDAAKKSSIGIESLKNTDPAELDEWRKLITSTIKDICHDLNVEVNSFIKSPAGMGVAGLIIYKVLGKDIIRGIKFSIWIPLYIMLMSFLMWLAKVLFLGKREAFTAESAKINDVEHKNVNGFHYLEPKVDIQGGDGFLAAVIFCLLALGLTIPTAIALLG